MGQHSLLGVGVLLAFLLAIAFVELLISVFGNTFAGFAMLLFTLAVAVGMRRANNV